MCVFGRLPASEPVECLRSLILHTYPWPRDRSCLFFFAPYWFAGADPAAVVLEGQPAPSRGGHPPVPAASAGVPFRQTHAGCERHQW